MISRGLLRGVRMYSTAGENKELALFLSDLMKRIDKITSQKPNLKQNNEEKNKPTKTRLSKQKGKFLNANKNAGGEASKSAKPRFARPVQKNVKISVSDHPLSSNVFSLMDEGNFKRRSSGERRSDGQSRSQRSDQKGKERLESRPQKHTGPRPQERSQDGQERRPRLQNRRNTSRDASNKSSRPRSFVSSEAKVDVEASSEVTSKEVEPEVRKPSINGDTFFYGKSAASLFGTSSRVSAVAKETLLKSRYPYKLPKLIIDSVTPGIHGNKFLLQKDWNLEVNPEELKGRLNEVVKGQTEKLTVDKKKTPQNILPAMEAAAQQLVKNGTYSMAQKKMVLDAASGFTSPKQLLENAHWLK